jgi:hypothetical protein
VTTPVILSTEELVTLCAEWQRRLRLQDWTVTVRRVRSSEFAGGPHFGGQVSFNNDKRAACIKIAEPDDYENTCNVDMERPQDMEYTLVHELLHLHVAPLNHLIKTDSIEERFEEHLVDSVARALVALKREATNG